MRSRSRRSWFVGSLACLCLVAGTTGLRADWLVTRDGQRIETRGPWEVRGKTVVFTLANGTLGSMRADQVDLEASRAVATEPEAEAESEPTPAERAPILVLTDADVSRRQPAREREQTDEGEGGGAGDAAPASGSVFVSGWEEEAEVGGDSFDIAGTVVNGGENMALNIEVVVTLWDEQGQRMVDRSAKMTTDHLKPGETTRFAATFERLFDFYDRVEIGVSSFDVLMKGGEDSREGQ